MFETVGKPCQSDAIKKIKQIITVQFKENKNADILSPCLIPFSDLE